MDHDAYFLTPNGHKPNETSPTLMDKKDTTPYTPGWTDNPVTKTPTADCEHGTFNINPQPTIKELNAASPSAREVLGKMEAPSADKPYIMPASEVLAMVKGELRNVAIASLNFNDRDIPHTNFDSIREIFDQLVAVGIKKDSEYGASWCRRLGPGAFFTIWRKIDRLEAQCELRKYDVFNVDEDPDSTESLDETLRDAIFYFALLLEKRAAKRAEIAKLLELRMKAVQMGMGQD